MAQLGRYELVKRLARGGMAELLLARQSGPEGFEKLLVIKRLLSSLSGQQDIVRMFLNEARIAARLAHPNIVQIFDLGRTGNEYFIAMEYVKGRDLRAVQKTADRLDRPIPYELSAYVLTCVCRGLHHAHSLRDSNGQPLGLVHRDVSPHNVLLSFSGDVKLADFGIAKATALAAETQAGVLKGKFAYMSPEQIRGIEIDARSDVFSAGTLLHELICWQRLFRRETDFATIRAVESEPIPPPSALRDDVPPALEQVVMKALQRDRDARYETAQQMQLDLETVISDLGWRCGPVELAGFLSSLFTETDRRKAVQLSTSRRSVRRSGRSDDPPPLFPASLSLRSGPLVRRSSVSYGVASDALASSGAPHAPSGSYPTTQLPPEAALGAPGAARAAPSIIGPIEAAVPDAFESTDEAPPTIIQPPSFDDVVPDDESEPLQDASGDYSDLQPGDDKEPRTVVVDDSLLVSQSDVSLEDAADAGESAAQLTPPQYVPLNPSSGLHTWDSFADGSELHEGNRTIEVLMIMGIVVSIALTVAIVVVIAITYARGQ